MAFFTAVLAEGLFFLSVHRTICVRVLARALAAAVGTVAILSRVSILQTPVADSEAFIVWCLGGDFVEA